MKKRPLFVFATDIDTGINTIPVSTIILVENYASNGLRIFTKTNNTGLTSTTTIAQALSGGNIVVVEALSGGNITDVGDLLIYQAFPPQSFRNRIINGDMAINQKNNSSSVTVTSGATLQYVTDQWYAYCTGANVTTQRVSGSLQSQYRQQFTGASGVTKIGFAQRMEASMTYDMNGQSTMISVDISNSLLTSVTYKVYYANTSDTFGTLASPTKTQIATGTITISSTIGRYFIPVNIPSVATTGIEIEFSVGAQTSGTWVIGNVQFEKVPTGATTGTAFEFLPYDVSMRRCQRYYKLGRVDFTGSIISGGIYGASYGIKGSMRVQPTVVTTITAVNGFPSSNPSVNISDSGYVQCVMTANATGSFGWFHATWTANAQL